MTVGGVPCKIQTQANKKITCKTGEYIKNHYVRLTGSSWFPQQLIVRQNDRINWSWATNQAVNVNLTSVEDMDSVLPTGEFNIPQIFGSVGEVTRIMKESPGEYFITSGYLDDLFSQES